jgi:hypothetical protein
MIIDLFEKAKRAENIGKMYSHVLSFTFVTNKSFKFFKLQIDHLNFLFVTDKSFKFFK